jgi:hypothetical protein
VLGQVSFGKAQTTALCDKIHQDMLSKFPTTSIKSYANCRKDNQLAILPYMVLSMFLQYKGNEIDILKNSPPSKPKSAINKALTNPLVVSPSKRAFSPQSNKQRAPAISGSKKWPQIEVCPTLLDDLTTPAPTNLDGHSFVQSVIGNPIPLPPYKSYYSDFDNQEEPESRFQM